MLSSDHLLAEETPLLNGKYKIGKALGVGPFAITYLAQHCQLNKPIIVKEFFMKGSCSRDGYNVICDPEKQNDFDVNKKQFIDEAMLLAKFNGNSLIIDVMDEFEENNTVYFTTPFIEGKPLHIYIEEDHPSGLEVNETTGLVFQIGSALGELHREGILHRNLSPDNIIVNKNGGITLIDFDFSVDFMLEGNQDLESISTEYRPVEQLQNQTNLKEPTDIYALGGIVYFLLTGKHPPSVMERLHENIGVNLTKKEHKPLQKLIDKAMAIRTSERYANVQELMNEVPTPKIRSKRNILAYSVLTVVIAGLLAFIYYQRNERINQVRGTQVVATDNEEVVIDEGEYYALLIGVDDYDNSDLDLDNPIQDARKVQSVLVQDYTFKDEHTFLMENPTKDDIINQLFELRDILTTKDNLLIFYAGHGHWDERAEQGYWMPRDADHESPAKWISNSTIKDKIRAMDAAHVLVISDACFSGAIFKFRSVESKDPDRAIDELNKLKSRRAMTSGNMTEVPDMSVFADYLVTGLHNNQDHYMSAGTFFQSFKEKVINNSEIGGLVPQYGILGTTGDEGGDFIFIRRE